MESIRHNKLIGFLQDELAVPATSIKLAIKRSENSPSILATILWEYGLITLTQLDRIFAWLETV
jgi:Protein of unknown function (DUF2949)